MLDANNNIIERSISLPGGAAITKRASGDVWSYTNIAGDVASTASRSGAKQGSTFIYDPYGTPMIGVPDNGSGSIDIAWTGHRPLEHEPSQLPLIEMGARPYSATLGRFLQVDSVLRGNADDYSYPGDPVNHADLDGRDLYSDYWWYSFINYITGHSDDTQPLYHGERGYTFFGARLIDGSGALVQPSAPPVDPVDALLRVLGWKSFWDDRHNARKEVSNILIATGTMGPSLTLGGFVVGATATLTDVLYDSLDTSCCAENTSTYRRQANSRDPRFNGNPNGGFYNPGLPARP